MQPLYESFIALLEMTTQSMTGCLVVPEQEFQYTAPRPATFETCRQACCSEASKRFRVDAQFDDVKVRDVRQKIEGEQRLHRDAKIYVTADPFQSIGQTGEEFVLAPAQSQSSQHSRGFAVCLQVQFSRCLLRRG